MAEKNHVTQLSWQPALLSDLTGNFLNELQLLQRQTVSVAVVMLETAPRFLPTVRYNVVQPLVAPRGRVPDVVDLKTSVMFAVNTTSLHGRWRDRHPITCHLNQSAASATLHAVPPPPGRDLYLQSGPKKL